MLQPFYKLTVLFNSYRYMVSEVALIIDGFSSLAISASFSLDITDSIIAEKWSEWKK